MVFQLKERRDGSIIKRTGDSNKRRIKMSTYSVYFSPTKGTKKVTNFLAEEMGTFEEIDLCRPVSEKRSFSKEDI